MSFSVNSILSFTIIAPNNSNYSDLNNYSIVIKLTYGVRSFLLMGDSETLSESEILTRKLTVKSDWIKLGHHGSNSSTSEAFLKAVSPKYAVLSCGIKNEFGHPSIETMSKLQKAKILVYRTDESGTIIFSSDGKTIIADKESGSYNSGSSTIGVKPTITPLLKYSSTPKNTPSLLITPLYTSTPALTPTPSTTPITMLTPTPTLSNNIDKTVYITKTGSKYHLLGCSYLKDSCISINLLDALNQGYTPCSRCNPPTK